MGIRSKLWLRVAGVAFAATVAIAALRPALGQTVAGSPQHFPGKFSQSKSDQFTPTQIQPNPEYKAEAPPRPRLTQPVMAGPDGVRTVASTDVDLASETPATQPASSLVPPALAAVPATVEPQTTPVPEAKKPELPTLAATPLAKPVEKPVATLPVATPTAKPVTPPLSGLVPAVATPGESNSTGTLPTKQSPAVTVEYEMPESVSVGQAFSYTLIVRNNSSTAVAGVRVEQELPVGAAYVSSEPAGEAMGEGKMGWSIGKLSGATDKRIKVTMKPAEEGELRGRATVSFTSIIEARTKVTRPRIAVAVSGTDVIKVGEKVPFQIKLSNTGTGPASKIGLRAQFSDGLTHTQGPVIEADILNLAAGAVRTLTLEVTASKPGQQQCQITAFVEGNAPESAKSTVTLVEPQLVVKQTGPVKCLVKAEPSYAIELSNPGTATTDPIQLWTVVPEGFDFIQASDGGTYNPSNRSCHWKLTGMAAGASKGVTMKIRSSTQTEAVIRTVAQASAPVEAQPQVGGIVPVAAKGKTLEARAETTVKSEGVPALRFDLSGAEGLVEVGKEAIYDIRVMNQGTGPCTNVQLIAELADGTSATKNDGPTLGRTTGQQIIFDPIAQLGVKGEAVYRVRVKGTLPGDMRFRMKLTCDQIKTPVVKEENTRFYKE